MEHNEFVVEFKDGTRDWVDPVDEDDVNVKEEVIEVTNSFNITCTYERNRIKQWVVRPYSEGTTYDPISAGVEDFQ